MSSTRRQKSLDMPIWRWILGIFYLVALIVFRVGVPQLAPKYGFYTSELESISNLVSLASTFQITVVLIYTLISFTTQRHSLNTIFLVVTLVGSFASLYSLSRIHRGETSSELEMLQFTRQYVSQHGKIPIWLQRAQLSDAKCCGILGFQDYPAFIYGQETDRRGKLGEDVPFSCCHDSRQGKEFKCPVKSASESDGNNKQKTSTNNINVNDDKEGVKSVFVRNEGWTEVLKSIEEINEESLQKLYAKSESEPESYFLLPLNSTKVGNYHTKGCYEVLVEQTVILYQVYFYFLLFITIMSWIFVLAFLVQGDNGQTLKQSSAFNSGSGTGRKKSRLGKFASRNLRKVERRQRKKEDEGKYF